MESYEGPEDADGKTTMSEASRAMQDDSDCASNPEERVKLEKCVVNPLAIRFSQAIIYRHFHNGMDVTEAISEVRGRHIPPDPGICCRRPAEANVMMYTPFPFIRVLKGKRSLTHLNDNNAPELQVSAEEDEADDLMFSIDNRRLYALQCAAMRRWPKRCLVEVFVMERLPYKRHAKKFDNYSDGYTVQFGHGRGSSDISMWCWFKEAEKREAESFFMPVDSVLALAKLVPSFFLLRDRLRPFLGEQAILFLIAGLIWACFVSWLRMFGPVDEFEHRLLQHHVLEIVNNDCWNLSDMLPESLANLLGCPSRIQRNDKPTKVVKSSSAQFCLTMFYVFLCFGGYVYVFIQQPIRDRVIRFCVVFCAVVCTYIYRYSTNPAKWKTDVRADY